MNKAQGFYFFSLLLFLLLPFSFSVQAQEPAPADTLQREQPEGRPVPLDESIERPVETVESAPKLDPGKAAFFSAVLPGLGQAYNNSHWKIPIIYLGGVLVVSSVRIYDRNYHSSLRQLEERTHFPQAEAGPNAPSMETLIRQTNYYRRQRDYTIIMGGLLYVLNIVEAYSYAHLQDFDLSDDLAMRVRPAVLAAPGTPGAGIALTLHIK